MAERVSAAILNWNGGELVLSCLRSLVQQTRAPDEIIIVDNASTDGSLEHLEQLQPGLRVVRNSVNVGFARAANQAVNAATGQWLLLLNLDIELSHEYIQRLLEAGDSDGRIGSLTGKLLRPLTGSAHTIDSTGHVLFRNGWAANRGEEMPDEGQWESSGEVFGVTAAAAMYRKAMLSDVVEGPARPFDERFFAYIEDVDLDWRMRWMGWKAWYVPVPAIHHRSATGGRRQTKILQHILKNRLLLVANNDLWPDGLKRVPGVVMFTLLTAVQFGLEAPRAPAGILHALQHLGGSVRRRRFLRRKRTVGPAEISAWMQPFPYRHKIARRLRFGTARAALPTST
jgi:GT2 family glycosyltransferase